MTDTKLAVTALIIHVLVCVIIWLAVRARALDVRGYFAPFMLCVPVWGPACVLLLHTKNKLIGRELISTNMEKLRINEERYRSIMVDKRGEEEITAPLEEVMIVDSAEQRRSLILSILNDSPEDYIDLLQQACLNDDTEVMHYASTAMAQISKEADLKLQKHEHRYALRPDDDEILAEYCDYLGEYLDSGLAQGRAAEIQQRQYLELLKKRMAKTEDYSLFCRMAQMQLKLKEYEAADETLDRMILRWPSREDAWLLRVQSAAARRDAALLNETKRLIEKNDVYLSSKGREALRFWFDDIGGRNVDEDENKAQ